MTRICIIEDDEDIALSLKYNLEKEGGYQVATYGDGETGMRETLRRAPDLVVLDLNLPGMDGIEVCRQLRAEPATTAVPIIMLTARVEESDKVQGLEIGADDYVTKPFSVKEVIARIRAVLRRSKNQERDEEALTAGVLSLDLAARRVDVDGRDVSLTRREFDFLADLMRHRGRVRTRERLLEQVWGYIHTGETRTVDVHVRQLRKKLGPPADTYIETVVGVGYRFREDA